MTIDRIVMIFAGSVVFIRSYLKIRIFVRDTAKPRINPLATILKKLGIKPGAAFG